MTRISVAKWGNSLAIRLPKKLAEGLGLGSGSEMDLDVTKGKLVATPMRRREPLARLVRKITPSNRHTASDWGRPVGNEVW